MSHNYEHGILFYHEHSGLDDINLGIGTATQYLSQMCKRVTVQLSEEKGQIKDYCKKIKEQTYAEDADILFILGGDGTVNELVNGVCENGLNLPIGVLPGGTFNDFTKTLNLDGNFKKASEQLPQTTQKAYDVMKVNGEYALNFAGMELMVQNAENVQDGSKDIFGKLSYIGSTIKTLANPTHFDYKMKVDDYTEEGDTSMILIANGRFIGGGKIPMTDMTPDDGTLNVFIFNDYSVSIMKDIFSLRDSMNWNEISENIGHVEGKHIQIETSPTMKVDVDGEIAYETPIDIEILPQHIEILTLQ
ncbi:diacylglycerol kinase family lipid kinase [Staphylococcus massiliensis]|uniref:diacylglycerol/lipid kinase family protein n=1 Tax=Staphylococcus massiliensis TaxID=555791 RepID=UPI001EDCD3E1|nr:diacylglycerol kinase family protein [Staphylococcus massiliensis]MCG3401816.1 diacylglycerol kinase family lipid kinase [Staphylococcus massiliensis]